MAETVGQLLQRPVKGFFTTVHVNGEVEGEVERSFYEEFKSELGRIWRLYDSAGLQLRVEFNNDDDVPRITTGWMNLRIHYNFNGHHQIFFKYLGKSQFQIIASENTITPDKFPTWHSKSRALRKVVTFAITIIEDPEVVPILPLPDNMGEYLWNTMLDQVYLIGTIKEKHRCELDYQRDPFAVTISSGWREVCGINRFRVGDRISFNMSSCNNPTLINTESVS